MILDYLGSPDDKEPVEKQDKTKQRDANEAGVRGTESGFEQDFFLKKAGLKATTVKN